MKIGVVLCVNEADNSLFAKPGVLRNWGRRLRRLDGIAAIIVAVPAALAAATGKTIRDAGWRCVPGPDDQLHRLAAAAAAFQLTAVVRLTPDNLLVPDQLLEKLVAIYREKSCPAAHTEGFPAGIAAAVIGTAALRTLCRQAKRTGRVAHPIQALAGISGVATFEAEPRYWNRGFSEWRGVGKVVVRGRGDRIPGLELKPNTPLTKRWSRGTNPPPVAAMVEKAVRETVRYQLGWSRSAEKPVRRKNLLMLNHTAIAGGAEHSLLETAAGLRSRRWRVHLGFLASGMMEARARQSGFTTAVFGPTGEPSWPAQLRVARYLDEHRIEVVYVNSVQALPAVLLPALERNLRIVVHIREFLDPSAIHRLSLGAASMIIANSNATASYLKGYVDPAQLRIIPNGIFPDRVKPAAGERPPRARGHEFLFGVFGRLAPYKGQHTAVAALRRLRDGGLEAGLVMAGSGFDLAGAVGYKNYVQNLSRSAHLEPHVFWFDHLANPFGMMAAVDAVAVPTEGEPFGRVILEALALGKPVIATDDGGPAEILPAACLIPSADPAALARALLGVRKGTVRLPNPRAILARFTFSRYLDRLESVLE